MSPSRAQYFPQKFPISHPATGQFSTLTTFFADNFSCLRSVFHYLRKIITRYFVIYSCAILQLRVFNVFHRFSYRFHCGKVENIVQRHKSFTFTVVTSWLHASFIYYRRLKFSAKGGYRMGMHSTYTATHYKDLNIDWQARAVTRHGEDILLTPQEFALLQVLFDHRGQAVSRGDLLHTAWGYPCIGITRTVDVHIQHLRRKLGLKQEIQTIYRVGYTLS
jgi:fumarate reductase subunit D